MEPPQGAGCLKYLAWAAQTFDDERFAEYYQHRASDLLILHGENLDDTTMDRLKALR